MRFFVRGALLLLALFSLVSTFSPPAQATAVGLIVNTTADTNDGSCDPLGFGTGNQDCTLREAITAANANTPSAETITFNVSGTIMLVGSGLPAINDDLTIDGTGQTITVDGASTYRVMIVNSGKTLTVNALTIANGSVSDFGGGILSIGTLDVTNSTFSGNSANGVFVLGGGIYNGGTLNVTNSTFSGNSLTGSDNNSGGGGIYNNGTMTVTNSTFSGNNSNKFGGGIANGGTLNVTNSTFSGNSATGIDGGGGIYNYSGRTLNVTNSTFYDNSAPTGSGGGGIRNDGTLNVTNSTFSSNSASVGGGISNTNVATTTLRNSIIANSTSGGDCFLQFGVGITADASNIDSDGTCDSATTKTTAQINLAALANNGGPTWTMKLQSPGDALSNGDNTVCGNAVGSPNFGAGGLDQRGAIRPQNTTCDVGAYELLFCSPGYFDNGSSPSCTAAPLGSFVALSGATAATPCPPGKYQGQMGQSSCLDADAGYYVPGFGSADQTQCSPGSNSADGAVVCFQTGPSFVVNDAADTDDTACDALPGDCTLREAINAANALAGANTITFDIPYTGCAVSSQGAAALDCMMSSGAMTPAAAIPSASSCSAANVCTIELASALPTIDETLTIDGSANSANITVSGANTFPVLFANGGAPLTVIGLTIADGYTTFHGAGIYAGDALTMTNVLVENSVSEQTAGGVAAEGPVVMTGSTLAGNTANSGGGGGAVFLYTANVSNSTFRSNKTDSASSGGGAYFTAAATLNNVAFEDNLAGLAGGGGAVFEGSANLTGGAFKNNIASFAGGGAYFNATTTIDATTFYSNSVLANRGGGAYFNGAATIQNALFNGNSAQADRGGGAYFRQDAQITATDFVTNTASNRAGGAYLNATATLTNTNFYSNTATVRGGGVYLGGASSVLGGVIQDNECTTGCFGGGAFVASTLVLTDTEFIDNTTDGDGGGAYTSANTTMTNALFDGNQSMGNSLSSQSINVIADPRGGGIAHTAGVLDLVGSTLTGNHADSLGGGILVQGGTVNVTSSTLSDNTSFEAGGGIHNGSSIVNVTNSLFLENRVDTDNLGDTIGGGGIYSGGAVTILNSTFSKNFGEASVGGGGGGLSNSGIAYVTNSTFSENSPGNGTAIYSSGPTLDIVNGTFSGNTGGAAFTIVAGGVMTLTNGTVAENTASAGSGGIYLSNGLATLVNSLVAANTPLDCFNSSGTLAADAFNLDSDGSCDNATQKTVAEINLGPLAPNGGATETMALLTDSAAIDHAPTASCAAAPVDGLDQRGQPRNLDGNGVASSNECDAGAFEAPTPASIVPRIIVHKQTLPDGDPTPFAFRLRGPVGRDFTLTDNEPHSTGQIPAGIYTLEEVLPPGWDPAIPLSSLTCDDGSPLSAVDLAADEVLVCRFLNYKRGDIVVKKVTIPPVAAPSFSMRLINNTSLQKTFFSLANAQQFDTGAITSVPTYKLLETVPGGWKRKSITCNNGSPSTAIAIPPGGTVTCTVTNENTAPTNISLSNSSVAENKSIGTLVGNLSATDAVGGDTHTFSFVNDGTPAAANNGNFQIMGKQLKTAKKFDFEAKSSHNIKLMVTDSAGQTKIKAFVISIVNGPN